ncbi:hypothetical protein ETAA8_43300 [Anatilimnocola aggregata]|uniref:Uncharacterized protein n=1 Tax=Anatilimnocola aggregata TaxID=2528021 RepID=A0A517YG72_9BACT|nr:hypothetical protein [Anatilimnocola aggregata]QDU29223.1 hypothetical protein ETAA8_43300 [Anatilimnocola aggregata]
MSVDISQCNSAYGEIKVRWSTVGEERLTRLPKLQPVQVMQWTLPADVTTNDPAHLPLEFLVVSDSAGNLRVVPRVQAQAFISQCCAFGPAILANVKPVSADQSFADQVHVLCYRWYRCRSLRQRRSFSSAADLAIRPGVLAGSISRTILPDEVGSIKRLLALGSDAARDDGDQHPSNKVAIAYGLCAAALQDPLSCTDEQVRELVHAALFERLDVSLPVSDKAEFDACLCEALANHRDDSGGAFDAWFSGPHSNVIKALTGMLKRTAKRMSPELVKAGLVELGWAGHFAVATYIQACMGWVQRCLAENLTPVAKEHFEKIYLPQPEFGGLPLLMLMDRAPLIAPLVPRLWEAPNDRRLIGALHRLFCIYGEMVNARRTLDKSAKRIRRKPVYQQPKSADSSPKPQLSADDKIKLLARLTELAQQVATRRNYNCRYCGNPLKFTIELDVFKQFEPLEACGLCPSHPGRSRTVKIAWAEATKVLRGEER